MKKIIIFTILLLICSIFTFYVTNWYLNGSRIDAIMQNLLSISEDIKNSEIDKIDPYFADNFDLRFEGKSYNLSQLKKNLSSSKDMFPEMQINQVSGSNNIIDVIAWTKLGEVDFRIFVTKYGVFDYRINKIELLEIDQKNTNLFKKLFIDYNTKIQ